jgi:hypothetical protein
VHPAARAGATFRVIIENGKFHGVMAATTPTGCLMVSICRPGAVGWSTCPLTLHHKTPEPHPSVLLSFCVGRSKEPLI